MVPHTARWFQRLGAWGIFLLVHTVSATLRYRWHDYSGHFTAASPGPVIYAIWHNRLALSMVVYHGYVRKHDPTAALAAMVSASKDGAFLAAILECFQVQPVRGSSSRRGPQALLELTSWAERGYSLAITPDGPRGPRYAVQDGTLALAQITGLPIIPATFHVRWKIQVRSWDRFQIPLPFARCDMVLGKTFRVPREATDAQRAAVREELERTMRELCVD